MTTQTFMQNLSPVGGRVLPQFSWRRWFKISLAAIVLSVGLGFYIFHFHADWAAEAVDLIRDVIGPKPVALVEEVVFMVQNWYNRAYYQTTGSIDPGWKLIAPTTSVSTSTAEAPPTIKPIIPDGAVFGEGQWRPLATVGQPAGQPPILWTTIIRPDPTQPFTHVSVVAMDLSRSRLQLMIGTQEPASQVYGPRPGMIPPDVQASGTLLAAWNGGFRTIHGHYGMMSDGITWLPPRNGLATLAIEKDGRVLISPWGQGDIPNPDMVAWRQNNPPLIVNGQIDPAIYDTTDSAEWGVTVSKTAYTWRTGLGLSQDGRWLIYVTGNSLTTESLTRALQAAGAYNAMQTDINSAFDRFDTYTATPHQESVKGHTVTLPLSAQKLVDKMFGESDQYLVPYNRDFFYLTGIPDPPQPAAPDSTLIALWQSVGGTNPTN